MRIVDRAAFMAMPSDTVYAVGATWHFGGMSIKGDTCSDREGNAIDWWAINPCDIETDSGDESIAAMEDMLANGASYPMIDSMTRDGRFDHGDIFLIFEKPDLERLAAMIGAAIAVASV